MSRGGRWSNQHVCPIVWPGRLEEDGVPHPRRRIKPRAYEYRKYIVLHARRNKHIEFVGGSGVAIQEELTSTMRPPTGIRRPHGSWVRHFVYSRHAAWRNLGNQNKGPPRRTRPFPATITRHNTSKYNSQHCTAANHSDCPRCFQTTATWAPGTAPHVTACLCSARRKTGTRDRVPRNRVPQCTARTAPRALRQPRQRSQPPRRCTTHTPRPGSSPARSPARLEIAQPHAAPTLAATSASITAPGGPPPPSSPPFPGGTPPARPRRPTATFGPHGEYRCYPAHASIPAIRQYPAAEALPLAEMTLPRLRILLAAFSASDVPGLFFPDVAYADFLAWTRTAFTQDAAASAVHRLLRAEYYRLQGGTCGVVIRAPGSPYHNAVGSHIFSHLAHALTAAGVRDAQSVVTCIVDERKSPPLPQPPALLSLGSWTMDSDAKGRSILKHRKPLLRRVPHAH
ncbi:hypothetical protein DFH27DRAFT_529264 [Peziza echinospora]|nr:hypothetical protein DFH27DRAFT_529264 [Peziza echinospora]